MSTDREKNILIASNLGLVSPFLIKQEINTINEINLKEDKHHIFAPPSQRALRRAEKRKLKPKYK